MRDVAWRLILYLSLAGLALGSYLTAVTLITSDLSFCSPHPLFSCEAVIGSAYSRLFGVPVALLGVLGFLGLFLTSYGALAAQGADRRRFVILGLGFAAAGLVFGGYLTYLELFVIQSVCPLCLATFALMVPITFLLLKALGEERKHAA